MNPNQQGKYLTCCTIALAQFSPSHGVLHPHSGPGQLTPPWPLGFFWDHFCGGTSTRNHYYPTLLPSCLSPEFYFCFVNTSLSASFGVTSGSVSGFVLDDCSQEGWETSNLGLLPEKPPLCPMSISLAKIYVFVEYQTHSMDS